MLFRSGESAGLELRPGRKAWVQVARGQAQVNGTLLKAGDGAAISAAGQVALIGETEAELLVFDLA